MKINDIYESTTSGSVATVAQPMTTQARNASIYGGKKGGNLLTGKKTSKKYANSVSESADTTKYKVQIICDDGGKTSYTVSAKTKEEALRKATKFANNDGYEDFQAKIVTENKKPVRESVGYPGIKDDEELRQFQNYPDAFNLYNKLRKDGVTFTKVHPRGKNRVDFDIVMSDRRHSLQMSASAPWVAMYEAQLEEDDLILVPGQGHRLKSGFIKHGESRLDHEVEMAKSDLFSAAKNAKQVYEMIADVSEEEGLEGWVQEKIIKANDYLNTIREYLEGKQLQEMTGGVIAGGGVGEGIGDTLKQVGKGISDKVTTMTKKNHSEKWFVSGHTLRKETSPGMGRAEYFVTNKEFPNKNEALAFIKEKQGKLNSYGKVGYFGLFAKSSDRYFSDEPLFSKIEDTNKNEVQEGIVDKIKGVVRREKAKDMPLVQTRRDYAMGKGGEAYNKGETRKGNQYMAYAEKDRKKARDPSDNPAGTYRTKTSDYSSKTIDEGAEDWRTDQMKWHGGSDISWYEHQKQNPIKVKLVNPSKMGGQPKGLYTVKSFNKISPTEAEIVVSHRGQELTGKVDLDNPATHLDKNYDKKRDMEFYSGQRPIAARQAFNLFQTKLHSKSSPAIDEIGEGIEDWDMRIQSLPKTSALKLKAITATSPGPTPKRYTFDTEKEAIQHFGQENWQFIKSGAPNKYGESWKVEYKNDATNEGIFGRFKNKTKKPSLNLPSWPDSNSANEWMAKKVAYYAQHDPENLPILFSPATGDYLPISVHTGSSWKPEHLKFYRELKKKYPDAVKKAKDITTGIAGTVSLSKVGDSEDFYGMSRYNVKPKLTDSADPFSKSFGQIRYALSPGVAKEYGIDGDTYHKLAKMAMEAKQLMERGLHFDQVVRKMNIPDGLKQTIRDGVYDIRSMAFIMGVQQYQEEQNSVKEGRVLGRGMSPEARARDIDQSDIEHIEQREFKDQWKQDNPGKKWPGYDKAGFKSRYDSKWD